MVYINMQVLDNNYMNMDLYLMFARNNGLIVILIKNLHLN